MCGRFPVFISYRHDERHVAEHVCAMLRAEFGVKNVFMDVGDEKSDAIPPGEDYRRFLRKTVRASKVILVVIGQRWLNARDKAGHRRLDDPRDVLRGEVRLGLFMAKKSQAK